MRDRHPWMSCPNCTYSESRDVHDELLCKKNAPIVTSGCAFGLWPLVKEHWCCGQFYTSNQCYEDIEAGKYD